MSIANVSRVAREHAPVSSRHAARVPTVSANASIVDVEIAAARGVLIARPCVQDPASRAAVASPSRGVPRYQPLSRCSCSARCDADARVDRDAAVGRGDHRVQVELGDLGMVVGEPAEPVERGRRARRRRRAARRGSRARAGPPCRGDELLGVDVGQRREPERRLADQLGEHAAGAERDERPEDGILDDAGEQLGAAVTSGWTSTGAPIRPPRRARRPRRGGRARRRRSRSCARRRRPTSRRPGSRARAAAATASSALGATRSGTSGTP